MMSTIRSEAKWGQDAPCLLIPTRSTMPPVRLAGLPVVGSVTCTVPSTQTWVVSLRTAIRSMWLEATGRCLTNFFVPATETLRLAWLTLTATGASLPSRTCTAPWLLLSTRSETRASTS